MAARSPPAARAGQAEEAEAAAAAVPVARRARTLDVVGRQVTRREEATQAAAPRTPAALRSAAPPATREVAANRARTAAATARPAPSITTRTRRLLAKIGGIAAR